MFDRKDIKPIPKYIAQMIKNKDKNYSNYVRFYAYYTTIKKELVKITVACKNFEKQWFCKQVAVHGVHSDTCYVKDMEYSLMGFSVGWYKQGISQEKRNYYDDDRWQTAEDKYYDPIAPIVNRKYPLKFEAYKYSCVDKYPYADAIKYLRIYEQYPETEYLMKLGLYHLATNKSILKKARKDKAFRKWLIANAEPLKNEYGNYGYYSGKTILFSYKENLSIVEGLKIAIAKDELLKDYNYKNYVSEIIPASEILDFLNYLDKQKTGISSYADYLRACQYLHLDMTLPKNKYPKDFKHWHDVRIDEYHTAQALEDEKKRKELYKQFTQIANKYSLLERNMNDDYAVIIAKSPTDLIKEGKKLNHCVGRMNYDQKFAREESLIFFVRNKDDLKTPFVTLEYSLQNHKVLQCYGYKDTKPTEQVLEFVNKKWLPYANRKIRKIA